MSCNIFDFECISDTDSEFMMEWGQCLTGELTQEEQEWSDKIVRAWTNFAIHRFKKRGKICYLQSFTRDFFQYHSDPTFDTTGALPNLPAWYVIVDGLL